MYSVGGRFVANNTIQNCLLKIQSFNNECHFDICHVTCHCENAFLAFGNKQEKEKYQPQIMANIEPTIEQQPRIDLFKIEQ